MSVLRRTLPVHRHPGSRRPHQVLLLAAATGAFVGFAVVALQRVMIDGLLDWVGRRPLSLQIVAPGVGLVIAWVSLRWLGDRASPTTTDAYIRNFHEEAHERLSAKPVLGRVLASVATVGYGGALGVEGASAYLGAVAGSTVQRRFARFFSREDAKLLMVAGVAAAIAAVFKAPAAGALFAIEVPYRSDIARRNVLPAMVGAAAGYVALAAVEGTTPLMSFVGGTAFGIVDLGAAAVVGLLAGGGARLVGIALRHLRRDVMAQVPTGARILAAAAGLGLLVLITEVATDAPRTLGPGLDVIAWATSDSRGQWLVLLLLVARLGAVLATVGGGGVGGLVFPLVVLGALTGRLVSGAFGTADTNLLLVVGMAAFLAAGYRTPLAAVMLVAETTASPGLVVPALLAVAASQLVIGDESVSEHQRAGRLGHLERRFELPISAVLETDVRTVPPDATIEEFLAVHLVGYRQRAVAVVEKGNRYLGLAVLDEIVAIRREAWSTTEIRTIARVTVPRGRTTWLLRDAVQAMEGADTDVLAVVDGHDRFVGVVTTEGILRLDEILERTGGAR